MTDLRKIAVLGGGNGAHAMAADLVLDRDKHARRYIEAYRQRNKQQK